MFAVFLTALFTSSCIKNINDDIPKTEPKLVINGIINPDSIFKVNISKTVHVFENETQQNLPFIQGAVVKVFKDGEFLFNLDEGNNGYYLKSGFYPSRAHIYKVEVEKAGYTTISAETGLPDFIPVNDFDTTIRITTDYGYPETVIDCKLQYHDPAGVENYYRLDCFVSYTDNDGVTFVERQYVYVDDANSHLYDKDYSYLLWSDVLNDGNDVTVDFNTYVYFYPDENSGMNSDSVELTYTVFLSTMSEDYYKYDKTRSLYYENGGSSDPFTEPVLIYTNVDNGYGIFGGAGSDTISFKYLYEIQK